MDKAIFMHHENGTGTLLAATGELKEDAHDVGSRDVEDFGLDTLLERQPVGLTTFDGEIVRYGEEIEWQGSFRATTIEDLKELKLINVD